MYLFPLTPSLVSAQIPSASSPSIPKQDQPPTYPKQPPTRPQPSHTSLPLFSTQVPHHLFQTKLPRGSASWHGGCYPPRYRRSIWKGSTILTSISRSCSLVSTAGPTLGCKIGGRGRQLTLLYFLGQALKFTEKSCRWIALGSSIPPRYSIRLSWLWIPRPR